MDSDRRPLVAIHAHLLAGEASYRSAGISSYIANLLRHLDPADAQVRYTALLGAAPLPDGVHLSILRTRFPTHTPWARIVWEQMVLPPLLLRLGARAFHATAFVGPLLAPCPQVITVHDLSFLRYPRYFRPANRHYLSLFTRMACRRAAAVLAVSDFTAREVATLLGVPPQRIHTVRHGVDPAFRPLPAAEVARFRQAQGLPPRFILYLGTLEPRKNLVTLVRAYAALREPDVPLYLVGGRGWLVDELFAEIERLGLQDRVHCPGFVPGESLPLWYNAATVFAYISHYEGFGLPVLEALACGAPTLTANTTSLPEAAGEGALAVPPDAVEAVTAGLRRLLDDASLRATLRQRGLAHAAGFTWQQSAQRTAQLYRQILKLD